MKLKDIYSSYLLMAALILLSLGIGNWVFGAVQITKYQRMLPATADTEAKDSYLSFQELDQRKSEEVLSRINKGSDGTSAARVKIDFYYVVLDGGRLLFFLGLFLTFLAFIRLIRQDSLNKVRRLRSKLLRNHP